MTASELFLKIQREKERQKSAFTGFDHTKRFEVKVSAEPVTTDILSTINAFALDPLTAEQVYACKFLLAHNGVDRDRERFPEPLLENFAKTLPGKSFLMAHRKGDPGKGLFFMAATEEMTSERFKEFTGEDARLPEGKGMVKVLWAWMYMLFNQYNEETILNIKAGIYRYVSIGFRATDLNPVKGAFDRVLYWEYVAPGEATEGSLVWLGAQQGATAQKGVGSGTDTGEREEHHEPTGGNKEMKEFLKMLMLLFSGKTFTEENWQKELKDAIDAQQKAAVEAATGPLSAKIAEMETQIKGLAVQAEDGKKYRADLVEKYVAGKRKLGDIDEKPETSEKAKKTAEGFSIGFLQEELKVLEKRIEEKFPASTQLKQGNQTQKEGEKDLHDLSPDE